MVDGSSCPRRGRLFKVHHNTAKDTAMSELLSPATWADTPGLQQLMRIQ